MVAQGNSLFNGQFHAIRSEPSGIPQRRWINTIPNNGLIRYKYMFNQERLLITNAKALSEVLTTNSYTYIKPPEVRVGLGRLLGVGVLLAEGEEHKVCDCCNICLDRADSGSASTQKSRTRILFSTYQRSLSSFLGQVRGTSPSPAEGYGSEKRQQ